MSNVIDIKKWKRDCDIHVSNGGFVRNCIIKQEDGNPITSVNGSGEEIITLDGYAIIPKIDYAALRLLEKPRASLFVRIKLKILSLI